jgi:hypothetical protein
MWRPWQTIDIVIFFVLVLVTHTDCSIACILLLVLLLVLLELTDLLETKLTSDVKSDRCQAHIGCLADRVSMAILMEG